MSDRAAADLHADLVALCEEAIDLAAGLDLDEHLADARSQRALERVMELIGEVAGRLEPTMPDADLPWRQMKAMRNLIAHAYHRVDHHLLLVTAQRELPDVLERLRQHPPPS